MTWPDARRAAITGLGVMCGLGDDVDTFFDGLVQGRSCIRRWDDPDPRSPARIGGEYGPFDLDAWLSEADLTDARAATMRKLLRSTPQAWHLTACAAVQAWRDADLDDVPADRVAHVCAGQNLSLSYVAANLDDYAVHPDDIEPLLGMIALDTDVLGVVGELLGVRGPSVLVGGACASGNLAALAGLDLIRCGRADAVLITGAPFPTHPMLRHALTVIEATSFLSFDDDPAAASRPFDRRREGFVQSESAGAVVLESVASLHRRGRPGRAELRGGASCSDATRLPRPHVEGQVRAIRGALADAGATAAEVDYVSAHATSTPVGDAAEVAALREALGPRALEIPINATKSMIGHGITSASVLELVATVLQLQRGVVHPTRNLDDPDDGLDLDFVPHHAREHPIDLALSNAFGFGGIDSTLAVGRLR